MVEGADTMLDIIAGDSNTVRLQIAEEVFEGADELVLKERCDPYIGGGYNLQEQFENKEINITIWLCAVTEFVFGRLPERIYVRRA